MRKLIYVSTLLLLLALPAVAQLPLFPTPAKEQLAKGSFLMGEGIQIQGNGGYADALAQTGRRQVIESFISWMESAVGACQEQRRWPIGKLRQRRSVEGGQ